MLLRVERDRAFADLALHAELRASDLPRRDRALATELSYGTLRLRGRIDALLDACIEGGLGRSQPAVRNLLRLGTYQILALSRIRNAAAVDETVELARAHGLEHATRFINAVLRKLASRVEEGRIRYPDPLEDPVGWLRDWGSLPEWLAERWLDRFGPEQAAELAETCLKPPPRTVHVSVGADPKALARRLGGRPCRFAPRGLTDLGQDPLRDPGFARGEFTVQDEASQLVELLVGAQPDETVVDCCAAFTGAQW